MQSSHNSHIKWSHACFVLSDVCSCVYRLFKDETYIHYKYIVIPKCVCTVNNNVAYFYFHENRTGRLWLANCFYIVYMNPQLQTNDSSYQTFIYDILHLKSSAVMCHRIMFFVLYWLCNIYMSLKNNNNLKSVQ